MPFVCPNCQPKLCRMCSHYKSMCRNWPMSSHCFSHYIKLLTARSYFLVGCPEVTNDQPFCMAAQRAPSSLLSSRWELCPSEWTELCTYVCREAACQSSLLACGKTRSMTMEAHWDVVVIHEMWTVRTWLTHNWEIKVTHRMHTYKYTCKLEVLHFPTLEHSLSKINCDQLVPPPLLGDQTGTTAEHVTTTRPDVIT